MSDAPQGSRPPQGTAVGAAVPSPRRIRRQPRGHADTGPATPRPPGRPARTNPVSACELYRDGRLVREGLRPSEALRSARESERAFVWLELHEPDERDLAEIAAAYRLHPLAVEDAVTAHQRPKLERYDDTLFVVLKTACYVEHAELTADSEIVRTGEVMAFVGADFVVTVRHGAPDGQDELRRRVAAAPAVTDSPLGVLHALCDHVVDDYITLTERLQVDVDTLEAAVFRPDEQASTGKVYQLKREVLEFKHAVGPLAAPLDALVSGAVAAVDEPMRQYFRDVADHLQLVREQIARYDELLTSILQATLAEVSITQNEDMRKISAWVAIGAVPTAVAAVYGMNFEHMPELGTTWGYPAVLAFMVVACLGLHHAFRRNGWL